MTSSPAAETPGGPWISGNFAVGTHSAGETSGENFAVATTLEDALH